MGGATMGSITFGVGAGDDQRPYTMSEDEYKKTMIKRRIALLKNQAKCILICTPILFMFGAIGIFLALQLTAAGTMIILLGFNIIIMLFSFVGVYVYKQIKSKLKDILYHKIVSD